MAAAPIGTKPYIPPRPQFPQPGQLMQGFLGILLQLTQLMLSRFQYGGGFPGGGYPQPPTFPGNAGYQNFNFGSAGSSGFLV